MPCLPSLRQECPSSRVPAACGQSRTPSRVPSGPLPCQCTVTFAQSIPSLNVRRKLRVQPEQPNPADDSRRKFSPRRAPADCPRNLVSSDNVYERVTLRCRGIFILYLGLTCDWVESELSFKGSERLGREPRVCGSSRNQTDSRRVIKQGGVFHRVVESSHGESPGHISGSTISCLLIRFMLVITTLSSLPLFQVPVRMHSIGNTDKIRNMQLIREERRKRKVKGPQWKKVVGRASDYTRSR